MLKWKYQKEDSYICPDFQIMLFEKRNTQPTKKKKPQWKYPTKSQLHDSLEELQMS